MLTGLQWHPSENFSQRKDWALPKLIVLHYTAMSSAEAALVRLCDPMYQVSAHYLISEYGVIWQLVEDCQRAWHAGVGCWGDIDDVNSYSIGIELANCGDHPFAEAQICALEDLLRALMGRWSLPAAAVIAHSDLAIGRKVDPGPRFDWQRLARQDLSVWPMPTTGGDFFANLAAFGYRLTGTDYAAKAALLQAFRLRFRPMATGPLDELDCQLAAGLSQKS
ncbi:MAG: N-acetylmuramoyl-L-alanine amidase [Paracoccaceae bacterium]|nr:N-acetylmuramoyl-L-alanine amidase [Paracoccaceae bacterium]